MFLKTFQSSRQKHRNHKFRKIYAVGGKDITPKTLVYNDIKEESRKSVSSSRGSTKTSVSKSLLDEIDIDDLVIDGEQKINDNAGGKSHKKEEHKEQISPSSEIKIFLKETPTYWLLEINGSILENYTSETEKEIQPEKLLPRKNKKLGFVQTFNLFSKKKASQTSPINKADKFLFATEWDLYDTYQTTCDSEDGESDDGFQHFKIDLEKSYEVRGIDRIPDEYKLPAILKPEEKSLDHSCNEQIVKLFQMSNFKQAAVISERLLSSNIYTAEQTAFSGYKCESKGDITQPSGFHYIMKLLWTFSYQGTSNKTVTSISWNTVNSNIVAVGYGKYFYEDEGEGLVCCWNVKNPDQPEKIYPINDIVTTLRFSKSEPFLLAVGCYKGQIILLNISTKTGDPVVINRNMKSTHFGTVWDMHWFMYTDFVNEREEIISVGHNGRIWKWNHREEYSCYELMQLQFCPPKVKTIINNAVDKTKVAVDVTVKNLLGLSLSVHPKNPMVYYVSTNEGCIVKCAINHPEQYIDIYPAHAGSVYGIQHSPFCENIFLTYGSDWVIYLWVENLHEPLLKLCSKGAVDGAKWSPTHSTIIASISGSRLSLWDLARKIIVPMSTVKGNTGVHLYSLDFSPSGKNILIGDIEGNVSVYNLIDMPFPPFLQTVTENFTWKNSY
ncbi:dynein axonemal intermediate chain 4-like isoform X2 [Lycorma delicatula]|uniref:dynein axonemal intermediate chain 4-like isoform X2 n=1 Tax=Lycorma delicatula TaxID=130591 RepID=UPI003F50F8AE